MSTSTPAKNSTPDTASAQSPVLLDLQQDYESLLESQRAITDIWETLADNQQVRCGAYPDVLDPDSISALDDTQLEPLAEHLRRAAIAIHQAVNLWKAECAHPRANPSSSVINEGLLATRAAANALDEAQELLAEIQ